MKFISICARTGMVECEIFAAAYRLCDLNNQPLPVVQVTGEVPPFDNAAGHALEMAEGDKARMSN